MIVVITSEAEADIEPIAAYVAAQSPTSALKLVRELRQRCESLADARAMSTRAFAGVPLAGS